MTKGKLARELKKPFVPSEPFDGIAEILVDRIQWFKTVDKAIDEAKKELLQEHFTVTMQLLDAQEIEYIAIQKKKFNEYFGESE